MPRPAYRPAALAGQVFIGSAAVRRELLTAHQLRSSAWIRVLHDVYADSTLDCDHDLKCRGAALRLPPSVVFAGPTAAYLDGIGHAATYRDDVHVIVPKKIRVGPRLGVRIHSTDLGPVESWTRGGGPPRTVPARTAWDVACWLDLAPAVSIIDAMLRTGLVQPAELTEIAHRYADRPWPGSRRARRAFALVDGRATSPAASVLRVRLALARVPRPVPHYPVRMPDRSLRVADLAWPRHRVGVVCDPAERADPVPRRPETIPAEGWWFIAVSAHRLRHDFTAVLREIHDALVARQGRS